VSRWSPKISKQDGKFTCNLISTSLPFVNLRSSSLLFNYLTCEFGLRDFAAAGGRVYTRKKTVTPISVPDNSVHGNPPLSKSGSEPSNGHPDGELNSNSQSDTNANAEPPVETLRQVEQTDDYNKSKMHNDNPMSGEFFRSVSPSQ
jgi:hypothetical protein